MYTNNFQLKIIPSRIYRLVIKSFSVAYGAVSRIIIPKITLSLSNVLLRTKMFTNISLKTRITFIGSLVDIIGYIYSQINVSKSPARIISIISEYGKMFIDKIIPPPVISILVKSIDRINNINLRVPKINFYAMAVANQFYTVTYHSSKSIDEMDEYEFDSGLQSRLEDIYRKTLGERWFKL